MGALHDNHMVKFDFCNNFSSCTCESYCGCVSLKHKENRPRQRLQTAGLPACRLGSLDRVLRSAARLIGGIPKFGHVSQYMLDVLHWLPAEQRISYRITSLVWRCLVGLAPVYL